MGEGQARRGARPTRRANTAYRHTHTHAHATATYLLDAPHEAARHQQRVADVKGVLHEQKQAALEHVFDGVAKDKLWS